jgi:hypothetical protein
MGQKRFSHFGAKTPVSDSSSLLPLDSAWQQEQMSSPWQIVPPIITTGHLPAIGRNSTPVTEPLSKRLPPGGVKAGQIQNEQAMQSSRAASWQKGIRPGLPPAGHISQWDGWESQPSRPSSKKKMRVKKPLPSMLQRSYAALMDSVFVLLAPLFTVAFFTRNPLIAFLVGAVAAFVVGLVRTFLALVKSVRGSKSALRRGIPGYFAFFFGLLQTFPFLLPTIQLALYINALVIALQLIALTIISSTFTIPS